MYEQFEKIKRDRRTDRRTEHGNNNIPALSLESEDMIIEMCSTRTTFISAVPSFRNLSILYRV